VDHVTTKAERETRNPSGGAKLNDRSGRMGDEAPGMISRLKLCRGEFVKVREDRSSTAWKK
jgi:hypothetical protein